MGVVSIIISVIALIISVWALKIRKETLDEQRSSKKLAMYQDLLGKFMTHNWKLYEVVSFEGLLVSRGGQQEALTLLVVEKRLFTIKENEK